MVLSVLITLPLLITPFSFGRGIVCPYRTTTSDYPFFFWPWYCLSLSHYHFWLRLFLLAVVLSVLIELPLLITPFSFGRGIVWPYRTTTSDYPVLFWLWYCLSLSNYHFSLRLFLLAVVLSVLIELPLLITPFTFGRGIVCPYRNTTSDYAFFFWPWYCLSLSKYHFWLRLFLLAVVLSVLIELPLLITPFSFDRGIVCPYRTTTSDYAFVFWKWYCLSLSNYHFWLRLYLLAVVLSVLIELPLLITPFSFDRGSVCPYHTTTSDYPFLLTVVVSVLITLPLLITPFSFDRGIVCPYRTTTSDYAFVFWKWYCLSLSNYHFWLRLYLLAVVLSVLIELPLLITPFSFDRGSVCPYHTTTSDYPFFFWPWYCLSLSNYHFWLRLCLLKVVLSVLIELPLLITPLSFGRGIVCPYRTTTSDYAFFLWYCLSLSNYHFWLRLFFWQWYCLSLSNYHFWLRFYLLAVVLSVLIELPLLITPFSFDRGIACPYRTTTSDYAFIFWPWYCLSLSHYHFWLPLFLLAVVLSVLIELPLLITPFSFGRGIVCPYHTTTSDYPFFFWPWYCLSLSNYHFWLPLFLLTVVLSVLIELPLLITPFSFGRGIVCPYRTTTSDYAFFFWPWYCLSLSKYHFWLRLFLLAVVLSVLIELPLLITLFSFGRGIVCPYRPSTSDYAFFFWLWYCLSLSNYHFWLRLFLLAVVLSVLIELPLLITPFSFGRGIVCPYRTTTSDYAFFFWPWYCLSLSKYHFWLRLFLLAVVLSVLIELPLLITLFSFGRGIVCPYRNTTSDYAFFFWPWYCLSLSNYHFWLPFFLLAVVLSVLITLPLLITPFSFGRGIVCPYRTTTSDYAFFFWPWYCLSLSTYDFWLRLYLLAVILSVVIELPLLITPFSFGRGIVCPYRNTTSDYAFFFWPWYCLSLSNYHFWLPFFLLAVVLSVLITLPLLITPFSFGRGIVCPYRPTTSDYAFFFWLWYCLSLLNYHFWLRLFLLAVVLSVLIDLRLLITPLSFGCDIVCRYWTTTSDYAFYFWLWYCLSLSNYHFWLRLFLLAVVLSVLIELPLLITPFFFWPWYCLSLSHYHFWLRLFLLAVVLSVLIEIPLLITPFSFGRGIVCPYRTTTSDYAFFFWPWYCLSLSNYHFWLRLFSFGRGIVCPYHTTTSDYAFFFWPWYCLSLSKYHFWLRLFLLAVVLSVLIELPLLITPFSFGRGIVCPYRTTTSDYAFFLLAVVLSVLITLPLLITPFSFGRGIVCPYRTTTSDYAFFLLAVVLSVLITLPLLITPFSFGRGIVCPYRNTTSDYAFFFWPWYCLSLSNYHFWLRLFLLAVVLSVLIELPLLITSFSFSRGIVCPYRTTTSDYAFFFWPWYCLSLSNYHFWLRLFLLAVVFSVVIELPLLITPLSFGRGIVCPYRTTTSDYAFWYLLAVALSVLIELPLLITPFGIFWPWYCLSLSNYHFWLRLLVSFDRGIVCPYRTTTSDYAFWYLLTVVLFVLIALRLLITPFGIFECFV